MSSAPAFVAVLGLGLRPTPAPVNFPGTVDSPPALMWQRDLPGPPLAASSHTELGEPVFDGGHVLVGSAGSNALYALDRSNGTLVFQYASNGPVQSAAVVVDDDIVFTDAAGYTWCYRRGEEEPLWKHYGGAPILSTPMVVDGVVYIANVGNAVYAIGLTDGQIRWRHEQEKDFTRIGELELYGAPSPTVHGHLVLAGFHNGAVVGLNRETGSREWQRQVGEGRYPDIIGSPVVVGGDVLVSAFSSPLVSLNLETQNVRWRVEAGASDAPVIQGDAVLFGGSDGRLLSIDAVTGAPNWTWNAPEAGSLTSPVVTDAGLFVGSSNGGVFLVDTDSGQTQWEMDAGYAIAGVSAELGVDGRQMVVVTNAGRILSLVVPLRGEREG